MRAKGGASRWFPGGEKPEMLGTILEGSSGYRSAVRTKGRFRKSQKEGSGLNHHHFRKVFRIGLFLAITILASGISAGAQDLAEIQAAIAAQGAKWRAVETSVMKLPKEKRQTLLGLIKGPEPEGEEPLAVSKSLAALPPVLDWRNNGGNWVTPVRNQGSCGSCWAFATAAALESYTLRQNNTPNQDLNTSEQVLVSCSGAGSCAGGYIGSASNYIRDTGLPPESCYPYTATNGSCSAACSTAFTNTQRIASWAYVCTTSPTVEGLKNALSTHGPLVTTMDVYSDFFSYGGGVYRYVTGTYQGGHAILLVGYDETQQAFLAKNSWGTGWGMGGYFYIAYSQLNAQNASPPGCEFGYYTIAYQETAPPPATCTYSVSPTSFNLPAAGGTNYKIAVTASAPSGCSSWRAATRAGWITILSPTGDTTGSGTVIFGAAPNLTGKTRKATISVAGQTVTVSQKRR